MGPAGRKVTGHAIISLNIPPPAEADVPTSPFSETEPPPPPPRPRALEAGDDERVEEEEEEAEDALKLPSPK